MPGLVADRDLDALVAQPADIGALGGVGALYGVAEIAQDLGDAAHADAADPDEVNGPDLARQSHDAIPVMVRTGCLASARRDKGFFRHSGALAEASEPGISRFRIGSLRDPSGMTDVRFRRLLPPDRPTARRHRA